jgi:hypothetical protein
MKRTTFTLALSTICFAALCLMAGSPGFSQVKPKALDPPVKILKPKIPEGIKKIGRAEISGLKIGTDATGTWTWTATIKNSGPAALDGKNLTVQGYSRAFPPAQNTWKPASGSIVSQGSLAPGQSVDVTRHWTRCCLTHELKVELRNSISNNTMDTKTLSGLIYSTAPKKPLNVKITRIEWDDSAKTWRATLKNFTDYTVKMGVQGYLWPADANTSVPAGGQRLTINPLEEKTSMALHASGAKNGDVLKVHIWADMNNDYCGEDWRDCGGKGSNNITIPNSRTY